MQSKESAKLANIRMLEFIASKLGSLRDEVVFLGGCTTALFIDDPNIPDVRYTVDVDCIIDVLSLNQYHQLEKKLKQLGFKQSLSEKVICRWHYDDAVLDVMPTDEKILGFSNRWYKEAIKHSSNYVLSKGNNIKTVSAAYFLATKIEAFKTRGKSDYYASRDFEDIVSVLDGRSVLAEDIKNSKESLKNYLIQALTDIYHNPSFKGAIPGHFVQYGKLAEDRIELLEQKIMAIIQGS
ncbi:MAG TPA: nucleotidyl transferase AbiEii/AbiGii toxin family protein [Gammaproteobacteria bacterium]|nr:nucleotidyl transferase AbiEii/AbiGii toxin family protein [Gammaproteobacteria bacterium]